MSVVLKCVFVNGLPLAFLSLVHFTGIAAAPGDQVVPRELTLEMARTLARNHPLLRAAAYEIEAERGDVRDAERYPNPDLSLSSEGIVFDSERGGAASRMQPSVTLRQEFLTGGKREKRRRVEEADTEIASARLNDLQRQLDFDVKRTYFEVVLAQRDLGLAEQVLDQFRTVVELNRLRLDAGEISGGELRRSEAAEYFFFADVVDAEVRLRTARAGLLALLGDIDPTADFRAIDDLESTFSAPSEAALRSAALRHRSDLALDRARADRADRVIELERSLSLPNVAAFAGYQKELDSAGPVIGVEIPLSLFNRNQGPVYRAISEKRRQENQLLYRRITVLKEVETALQGLRGDGRRVDALENNYLQKAREARNITETSYRLGEASLSEFLEAERTYAETMQHYHRALFDFRVSKARLEKAVGEDL